MSNMYSNSLARHRDPKAKREVKLKKLEESWKITPSEGIPEYSTENDKYCPLGITRLFNESQKSKVKTSKVTNEDTAHWIKANISNKFEEVPEKFTSSIVQRAAYPPNSSDIPDASILHKIIVRENLIVEIKKLIQHQNDIDAARSEVSELVKAVRYETIDIVDDISQWKSNQSFSREFLFRGVNYLAKMFSDLDFLDDYDEFNFGFPITGNPLVFPYYGGRQLPDHLRFTSSSVLDSKSGFVSKKSRVEDDILVDGIELSRLQMCDKIIRDEVEHRSHSKKYQTNKHNQNVQLSSNDPSGLAVGENGMNDSYLSGLHRAVGAPSASLNVSFRDTVDTFHEPSTASYGELAPLPPLGKTQSLSMGATSSPDVMSADKGGPPFAQDSIQLNNSIRFPSNPDAHNTRMSISKKSSKKKKTNIHVFASPPKGSTHSAPPAKWIVKTNHIKQMKDRIEVLTEEIGVVKAMHAHVADQVEFKISEYDQLSNIRNGLENKRLLAVSQSRPAKAQDYAIKVNVADMELQQIQFTVKDLQRQKFFFEQEIKRKRKTVARLEVDIKNGIKQAAIQRKLEKRAEKEGLLAVLRSHNRGDSPDSVEKDLSNGELDRTDELNIEDTEGLGASDEDEDSLEGEMANVASASSFVSKSEPMSGMQSAPQLSNIYPADSTFSSIFEADNETNRASPSILRIEEENSLDLSKNITYEEELDNKTDLQNGSNPSGNSNADSALETKGSIASMDSPVVGSGYSFVKSTKEKMKDELKKNESSVVEEQLLKQHACVVNNEVVTVGMYSNESTGVTTLRAYNDKGDATLTYELIPALAKQLKELPDEETNSFISEMLNTTVVPSNMGTEYAKEQSRKKTNDNVDNTFSSFMDEEREMVDNFSQKAVDPNATFESEVNNVKYSSRLEFKDEGAIEIHALNTASGAKHVIPLLPVLAKQIVSLTYDQISGVILDLIKAFSHSV